MEKENDIFERPNRVQNMNHLFEEEQTSESTRVSIEPAVTVQIPASRKIREVSDETASAARTRQTAPSGASAQRSAQPRRTAPADSSAQPRRSTAAPAGASAQPRRSASSASSQQARRPQQARPVQPEQAQARRIRQTDAQAASGQPRQVSSENAQTVRPRTARPSQAQPRQAQPRQTQSANRSRSQASSSRPEHITRSASGNNQAKRSASSGSGNGRGKKKRMSGFKKGILIYSAILLVILIVGTIVFSSFLSSLEQSQPANLIAGVAENFTEKKVGSYLKSQSDKINSFGDPNDLIDEYTKKLEGVTKASYIENKDYRADAPSYDITSDGKTIAKITLEKAGNGPFGLTKWEIASIDIAEYMDLGAIEILAPVGSVVTVNGTEIDEKYATGPESIPENLVTAAKYVTIPSYITYKVSGVPGTPEVAATDASGTKLPITQAENKYIVGADTSQEFIDSVSGLVNNAIEAWGKHFINMGGNLSAYIMEGSDWYGYIFGSADMDPIMTSFYEFESIADYQFTEKEAKNYIRYTKDCFTVDVHYKMRVDFNNDRMSDENQKLDATWVFVTKNDGQDWYIVDCIYQ